MKSFQQKKEELAKLKEKLAKSKLTVFTSFAQKGEKGLNVSDMQTLKKNLRKTDSEYTVGKKTLLDKALKSKFRNVDMSGEADIFSFDGSLGVVFGYGDEIAAAKSVYDFSRKNKALKLFGALFGSKFIDAKNFIELAKLPGREVLIGRIMGLMKYHVSLLANVLNQVAKDRK